MFRYSRLLLFSLLSGTFLLAMSGCGPAAAPSEGSTSTVSSLDSLPETMLYAVMVNNLRLRTQPQQPSDVVTRVSVGEFLIGMGETSPMEDTATLRGRFYTAPYYLVKTTRPEEETGYVFGGAVKLVYAGAAATSPDLGQLTNLSQFLQTLPPHELASAGKAWEYVRGQLVSDQASLGDACYVLLSDFLENLQMSADLYAMTDTLTWEDRHYEQVYEGTFDMSTFPITQALKDNGFVLQTMEGMIFPAIDEQALFDLFDRKVSPALQQFLTLRLQTFKQPSMSDAALLITWDELGYRAASWEALAMEYPHFVMVEEATHRAQWMSAMFLAGSDNTSIYDYETKNILPETRNAWESAVQRYPNSELATKTKALLQLVDASGGKYNEEIARYTEQLFNH